MPFLLLMLATLIVATAVRGRNMSGKVFPSKRFANVFLKAGVDDSQLSRETAHALEILPSLTDREGFGLVVVTATYDGQHLPNSLHYRNRAFDLRSIHLPAIRRGELARAIRMALPSGFDVLSEGPGAGYDRQNPVPHIHVEYDPHA